MSIGEVSCGMDIIEIERIKEDIEKLQEKFLNRVFTDNEIEYCESRNVQKYQHYAGRFAAKEAIFKAISKELDNKYSVSWKDFEVVNDGQGRPIVNLFNICKQKIKSIDISITHCELYAAACTMILWESEEI
ncbi:MAG: holo-ACP synthase [Clostridia bacterium]|jgi:holo-[acyl-carrier protein] synthase|nr:holo-ACP synthase [Clostridia bacterium]